MFSRFFIDRPILASVPSIIITLAGLAAVFSLPVSQYPEITPPTVRVNCTYPGASAQVIESQITQPIEDALSGVEGIQYIQSVSREQLTGFHGFIGRYRAAARDPSPAAVRPAR